MKLIATLFFLTCSAFAWQCPAPYSPVPIKEQPGWVYCGVTVYLVTTEIGPQGPQGVAGPRGLQGIPGVQGVPGPQGIQGPTYVPPVTPINWTGWSASGGGATATLSEDGSRVLIRCPLTPGICGFTHGFEGQMTVKIETSFDPQWGSAWFGLIPSPGAKPIGILNAFDLNGKWGACITDQDGMCSTVSTLKALPRNNVYWMRIKDGSVDYSSDGIVWYAQVAVSGGQVFLGAFNGGTFWLDLVQQ